MVFFSFVLILIIQLFLKNMYNSMYLNCTAFIYISLMGCLSYESVLTESLSKWLLIQFNNPSHLGSPGLTKS